MNQELTPIKSNYLGMTQVLLKFVVYVSVYYIFEMTLALQWLLLILVGVSIIISVAKPNKKITSGGMKMQTGVLYNWGYAVVTITGILLFFLPRVERLSSLCVVVLLSIVVDSLIYITWRKAEAGE